MLRTSKKLPVGRITGAAINKQAALTHALRFIKNNEGLLMNQYRHFSQQQNQTREFLSYFKFRGQEQNVEENPLRKYPTLYLVFALLILGYSYAFIATLLSTDYVLDKLIGENYDFHKVSILPLSLYALCKLKERYLRYILKDLESSDEEKRKCALQLLYQMCLDRSLAKSIHKESICLPLVLQLFKNPELQPIERDMALGLLRIFSDMESTHSLLVENMPLILKSSALNQPNSVLENAYSTISLNLLSHTSTISTLKEKHIENLFQISYQLSQSKTKKVKVLGQHSCEVLIRLSKNDLDDKKKIDEMNKQMEKYLANYDRSKFFSNNMVIPVLTFVYAFARYKWRANRLTISTNINLNKMALKRAFKSSMVLTAISLMVSSIDYMEYKRGLTDFRNVNYLEKLDSRAKRQEFEKVVQSFIGPLFVAWLLSRAEFIILPYLVAQATASSEPFSLIEQIRSPFSEVYLQDQYKYIVENVDHDKKQ